MSTTKRCYYETLEVERDADENKLKAAFRKLAMKWHPDRNPGDAASEVRFKEINEAYEVLKDGDKRAAYDRYGHAAFEQGGQAAAVPASVPDLPRHSRTFSRTCSAWPGNAAAAADASVARTCATIWRSRWKRRIQGKTAKIEIPVSVTCEACSGHRRQGRHQAEELLDLRRRRARPAGARASSPWSAPARAARAAAR